MPKISVIMPVYNGGKYLHESIDSILNQTYKDFEFIIINDCSIDGTEDIILSYHDSRIHYYKNEQNRGVAVTLNRGFDIAVGEYIARMDADDISLPERFEKQVQYMDGHPDVVVLGTAIEIFGDGTKNIVKRFSTDSESIKVDLFFSSALAHPTVMLRKAVLNKEKLYYDCRYDKIEDYELWDRISVNYMIEALPDILLKYRIHNNQITQNYSTKHIQKLRKLKKRQIERLQVSTDTKELEQYFAYCSGSFKVQYSSVIEFLNFLIKILIANNKYGFYNADTLQAAFRNVAFNYMTSTELIGEDILTIYRNYSKPFRLQLHHKIIVMFKLIRRKCLTALISLKLRLQTDIRRKKLKNRSFSIISNNCWAGFIYQKYGLAYQTPTIGLGIYGDDYIKFCKNLKYYTSRQLKFISFKSAKYHYFINNSVPYPIAQIDDIEIHFGHYSTEQEAKEKWERRCKRINWDNIIYKVSQREGFTTENMKEFLQLDVENKLCFVKEPLDGGIFIPKLNGCIGDETPIISFNFNELSYLNNLLKLKG